MTTPLTIEEANEFYDADIRTPLLYKGDEIHGYGVCAKTGIIYFNQTHPYQPKGWKVKKEQLHGKSKYPQNQLKMSCGKKKTFGQHILVQWTLNPEIPALPGVSKKEWKRTPTVVKLHCRELWQVNHIDHNVLNFTPSNLEWVTKEQNKEAYLRFCQNK